MKRKHFIVFLFITACLLGSACAIARDISERIKEKSFKNKVEAEFKEDFPAYEVSGVVIRNINQREREAMIFYYKPDVKGVFTAEWKYHDRDENLDNSKEDWQLIEKCGEWEVRIRKD